MEDAGRYGLMLAAAAAAVWIGRKAAARLLLSRAKHRSLAGHPRWARRIARMLPAHSYDEQQFFTADGAPEPVAARRREEFDQLRQLWRQRYPQTMAMSRELARRSADVDFTARYRVPFQFSELVRAQLPSGAVLQAAEGRWLVDPDGNRSLDL